MHVKLHLIHFPFSILESGSIVPARGPTSFGWDPVSTVQYITVHLADLL